MEKLHIAQTQSLINTRRGIHSNYCLEELLSPPTFYARLCQLLWHVIFSPTKRETSLSIGHAWFNVNFYEKHYLCQEQKIENILMLTIFYHSPTQHRLYSQSDLHKVPRVLKKVQKSKLLYLRIKVIGDKISFHFKQHPLLHKINKMQIELLQYQV